MKLVADQIRPYAGHIALVAVVPSWLTAFAVQAEPVLHDLALIATFVSGVFAAFWYWRQFRK